jgi:ketosteroid isomerase-like protein
MPAMADTDDGDREGVSQANHAFYRAFVNRDLAAMETLWAKATPVACLHPGQAPLLTRDAIMASWQAILRNPSSPTEIRLIEDSIVVRGPMAVVVCREILPSAHLMATNAFVREGDMWKMAHHQSALAPPPSDRQTPSASPPRRDRRNLH